MGVVCPCPGAKYLYMTIFSNIFLSKTARPIKAKLRVEPPREEGKEIYINDTGHMTKIYGKNLQKSSPTEQIVL